MKPKIAIVNSSSFGNVFPGHRKELESFAEITRISVPVTIEAAELVEKLTRFHGIVASVNPDYPDNVIAHLPNLVAITRHGIGYNNVNVESATEHGIVVTKVEGPIERAAVAELAVALLLSAARCIPDGQTAVRKNRWADRASFVGVELQDKKIACIGLGNIGSRAAAILKNGFNATILAHDPGFSDQDILALGFEPTPLYDALAQADFITLHCALTKDNYHLLNAETIATLKDGVIIANTARGELVDDKAIIAALQSGKVRNYATDVVEGEPIDNTHPLLQEPAAIVVPHLGGYTIESLTGMGRTMVDNMREIFVEANVPSNAINGSAITTVKKWE